MVYLPFSRVLLFIGWLHVWCCVWILCELACDFVYVFTSCFGFAFELLLCWLIDAVELLGY